MGSIDRFEISGAVFDEVIDKTVEALEDCFGSDGDCQVHINRIDDVFAVQPSDEGDRVDTEVDDVFSD